MLLRLLWLFELFWESEERRLDGFTLVLEDFRFELELFGRFEEEDPELPDFDRLRVVFDIVLAGEESLRALSLEGRLMDCDELSLFRSPSRILSDPFILSLPDFLDKIIRSDEDVPRTTDGDENGF